VGAAALIGLAFWLLPAVFGAGFAPAAPALQMLALSLLPFALRGVRTIYWYACGGERYVNWVNGAALVLQLALGLWLIPAYGAVGAALSVVLVESAALALLSRRAAR
jgi:O-antigen/teichoic acid export membrane protein